MTCFSSRCSFIIALVIGWTSCCWGQQSADRLLRLVPADAGVTLTIEDLRIHSREFFESPLSERIQGFPAVQRWYASDVYRQLDQAKQRLEKRLGESSTSFRDRLFGEAVVLSIVTPPGGRPEDSRGLFLVQMSDRKLLDRVLQSVNEAQLRRGELSKVSERRYKTLTYTARHYAGDQPRLPDYYATCHARNFAWANSEELINAVIDRNAANQGGLAENADFQKVRSRLPRSAAVSLYLKPRLLEQVFVSSSKPSSPHEEKIAKLIQRYLSAQKYVGAAIEWKDGLILHTQEELEPEKVGSWYQRWSKVVARPANLETLPPNTVAHASIQLDFPALEESIRELIPDDQRARYENGLLALKGILLGQDLKQVLPKLGPRVSGTLIASASPELTLSPVARVDLNGDETLAETLTNGLRTTLALYGMDESHGNGQLRLESRQEAGTSTMFLVPTTPFAFSVNRDRLLIGRNAASLAIEPESAAGARDEFAATRAAYFPQAESYLWVDIKAVRSLADRHREMLIQKMMKHDQKARAVAQADLDKLLTFLGLFRSIYVTSELASGGQSLHRTLGLLSREAGGAPSPAASIR